MKLSTSSSTIFGSVLLLLVAATVQANCSDVHVVFARGTGETPGFGKCGDPFVSNITSNLANLTVSSYAVDYSTSPDQLDAGDGATDMTDHVVTMAKQCSTTIFVLGGYSQGATAVDISIGINTILGSGDVIPESLSSRVLAIVTFGNPLRLFGKDIAESSSIYGSKAIEFCNKGDPVCGNGLNIEAHLAYPTDGTVPSAAQQAANLVKTNYKL